MLCTLVTAQGQEDLNKCWTPETLLQIMFPAAGASGASEQSDPRLLTVSGSPTLGDYEKQNQTNTHFTYSAGNQQERAIQDNEQTAFRYRIS
jgi:hypothetical protein